MDPSSAPLDEAEMAAWRMFPRTHVALTTMVAAQRLAAHPRSRASDDAPVQPAETPDQPRRLSELAGAVLLSRSGLTRLVDRLADGGLVARRSCDHDVRGTDPVRTDAGRRRLAAAAPVHLARARTHGTARLDAGQPRGLTEVPARMAEPAWPTPPGTGGRRAPAGPASCEPAASPGSPASGGEPPTADGRLAQVPER